MKTIQNALTAAVIATALSLPMAGAAFAADQAAPMILAMNHGDSAEHKGAEAGEAASDTWITTKVKSALLAEGATSGMDIEVETNDGVVSLSGTVASEAERELAIQKAHEIEGVREVSADGLKTAD